MKMTQDMRKEKTKQAFGKAAANLAKADTRLRQAQKNRAVANAAYNQAWVNFDIARNTSLNTLL